MPYPIRPLRKSTSWPGRKMFALSAATAAVSRPHVFALGNSGMKKTRVFLIIALMDLTGLDFDKELMTLALEEAQQALGRDEVPIGAVIAKEGQGKARRHQRAEER